MKKKVVGILLFPDVEVLDFAGPFEVFSRVRTVPGPASRISEDSAPFQVLTVGIEPGELVATGGLRVVADVAMDDAPPIDILVVPGGFGTRPLLDNERVLTWIKERAEVAELVTSVCTGALLFAKIGLLRGRQATTHQGALDQLAKMDPTITVHGDRRFVDDGIITSGGVAAGVDMAFHVVEKYCGVDVADETSRYIEYPRP